MATAHIRIANINYACSTLIIGRLQHMDDITLSDFKKDLKGAIRDAELAKTKDYWNLSEQQALQGYKAKDFAFVVACTQQDQIGPERCLQDMGFTHTRRVSKKKNPNTKCIFWMLEAEDFFNSLEDEFQLGTPPSEYASIG